MSFKQLLQYAISRMDETEAACVLDRSGIVFRVGVQEVKVVGDQFVNEHGQVVTVSVGAVTGLTLPEIEKVSESKAPEIKKPETKAPEIRVAPPSVAPSSAPAVQNRMSR